MMSIDTDMIISRFNTYESRTILPNLPELLLKLVTFQLTEPPLGLQNQTSFPSKEHLKHLTV